MRAWIIAALAFAVAACTGETPREGEAAAPAEGYTLEVLAQEPDEQIYLVSHSDGALAAARKTAEVSELLTAEAARMLISERQAAFQTPQNEAVAIRAPGFSLSIKGDEGQSDGAVSIDINTGEGRGVSVRADGQGEPDRAHVRIAGAGPSEARDFINDSELSPEVKAEMLQELGL